MQLYNISHYCAFCCCYVAGSKDKINGIIASDESGESVGFITWLEMPLLPPLIGNQWYIPYLFVKPDARKKGIAKGLISELMKSAVHNHIQQVLIIYPNEEVMQYWYELGFDIFVFRYLFSGNNGNFPIGIGKKYYVIFIVKNMTRLNLIIRSDKK